MAADGAFEKKVKVRFADIDQAGIVYYPKILHYCHTVMEDSSTSGWAFRTRSCSGSAASAFRPCG
jgi:acyl-CoA thioesterase FadM